jgi:LacI family transcriptional regulator
VSKLFNEITSQEIAKLAGVSRSTVSKVINNYSDVSKDTYEKVMKIVKEYNYYPNLSAQALKGKETKTLGLFMISPALFSDDVHSDTMIGKVIENAAMLGYHVLTYIIRNPKDIEAFETVKEAFYQKRISGGIFIGAENHEPLVEELIAEGFPVGIMDQNLAGREEPNRIVINFQCEESSTHAIDYLVSLNHKKIAIINGNLNKYSGAQKYKGFIEGIRKNNLEIPDPWITYGDFSESSGFALMGKILDSSYGMPTAVCCANDLIAFGAIKAIEKRGLALPNDISIIGSDDHLLSSYIKPALTTYKVNFAQILKLLTCKVVEYIEKGYVKTNTKNNELSIDFIVRDSCRRI